MVGKGGNLQVSRGFPGPHLPIHPNPSFPKLFRTVAAVEARIENKNKARRIVVKQVGEEAVLGDC